jgi:hypothetical protein
MSVIRTDNVVQHPLGEKAFRRQISPQVFLHISTLNGREQSVLIELLGRRSAQNDGKML